jgi:hypothetical protein
VIPFTSITRLAGGKWRFDWVPTGADLYRVVLNGLFIQSIDAPPLDLGAHGSDHEPPPIELVEDDGVVLSEKFSPYFILEWWPNPDCDPICWVAKYHREGFATLRVPGWRIDRRDWLYLDREVCGLAGAEIIRFFIQLV